jgi:hypothetical protein
MMSFAYSSPIAVPAIGVILVAPPEHSVAIEVIKGAMSLASQQAIHHAISRAKSHAKNKELLTCDPTYAQDSSSPPPLYR